MKTYISNGREGSWRGRIVQMADDQFMHYPDWPDQRHGNPYTVNQEQLQRYLQNGYWNRLETETTMDEGL